jgi:error-prone DNA polymerase
MYAELVCASNYSFLEGASHPEELVERARDLSLAALALTDRDGLYGAVKASLAAKACGLKFLLGTRLTLDDGPALCVYPQDLGGYQNLCRLLSHSRLTHKKGEAGLSWKTVAERADGLWAVLPRPAAVDHVAPLAEAFAGRFYVGLSRTLSAGDEALVHEACALARTLELPRLAHNDVHTHLRGRQPLQDVVSAIRLKTTVALAQGKLYPNAERTLKGPGEMLELFADAPDAVGRTLELVDACEFSLDELRYQFAREQLPPGLTPQQYLVQLVEQGARQRYPGGVPEAVKKQLAKELHLIEALDFPGYFLSIWDIVRFAREKGILCQGRGSAANSAVCYALHITAIDPVRMGLLFERFLSMERKEPPDIDVDFEHDRREEVLQYVYQRHGRHRAAMVCEHICFRNKLATKEVGKALGLSVDQVDRLSKAIDLSADDGIGEFQLREAGLSASDLAVRQTVQLARELTGMPRHLSIHVGGFVVTHDDLVALVPVENASMADRTVVQWEKDDLSALNILKVDLLGLGMLTAVRRTFELVAAHEGRALTMATVPAEDPEVYEMICRADTIGVFQIESRAQMNMLPRLKPRCFYDLVIEIAIIRPGPIIGDMVHPFLRRRDGVEPVTYPSPEVKEILERTLGIPLFQEQAMRLAMVAAGFSAGDADQLRRVLSHKRALELLPRFKERFIEGCRQRGYPDAFTHACFEQFKGFAHYGFPESHSASFALIAYASCYLKRYHPAAFTAALIDAQPMGFYAVHTLVDDCRRHGVEVRPVDVNASKWECTLEEGQRSEVRGRSTSGHAGFAAGAAPATWGKGGPALRLGFELVKGLQQELAKRLVAAREAGGPFVSVGDLARRAQLPRHAMTRLALAGALEGLSTGRRVALWDIAALGPLEDEDLFYGLPMDETAADLPPLQLGERVMTDYDTLGLSLEKHPVELLRPHLKKRGAVTAEGLSKVRHGQRVKVGGLVIVRQRPPTAKGFTFLSVEDETGVSNFVVEPQLFGKFRREITQTALVLAEGIVEKVGRVVNLKVRSLERL